MIDIGNKKVISADDVRDEKPHTREVLAIAFARDGQFDLAVDIQKELKNYISRQQNTDKRRLERLKFQYNLYRKDKAYTEGMENE